jgi:hypothetical protein
VAPEHEGSSPHSQQPATGPYPEPGESTPHTPSQSSEGPLWAHPPIYALVFQVIFSFRSSHQTLYTVFPSPMRATCPAHLILLDMIYLMMSGEE